MSAADPSTPAQLAEIARDPEAYRLPPEEWPPGTAEALEALGPGASVYRRPGDGVVTILDADSLQMGSMVARFGWQD